jgi:hypothetical protein
LRQSRAELKLRRQERTAWLQQKIDFEKLLAELAARLKMPSGASRLSGTGQQLRMKARVAPPTLGEALNLGKDG